jgi:hypothetical protein
MGPNHAILRYMSSEAARKAWITRKGGGGGASTPSAGRPKTTAGGKRILWQGNSKAYAKALAKKINAIRRTTASNSPSPSKTFYKPKAAPRNYSRTSVINRSKTFGGPLFGKKFVLMK